VLANLKLEKLLFTLLDDCEEVNAENYMLKDVCSELKKDMRLLEKNKQELELKDFCEHERERV